MMLQQLALLKGFDLDGLDPAGPTSSISQVECAKLAFADRETFYGDPDFVDVPMRDAAVRRLQRRAPQADRRAAPRSSCARARSRASAGRRAAARVPTASARRSARSGAGEPTVGRHGRSRAATPCISTSSTGPATWSRRRRRAAGCNPRRSSRSSASASARARRCSGSTRAIPAALAPGKRPRTTLSPTMALRDGEPYLAWGTPGGDQQDQWITQFFLRHVHARHEPAGGDRRAGLAHRAFPVSFWPRTARPGVLVVEGRVPEATIDELRRRGHIVEVGPDWSEGRLTAASRDGARRRAAANPRGMQGYAAGR